MAFNFASRHIFGSSLWGMLGAPHKIKDMIIISQEKGQTLDGNKLLFHRKRDRPWMEIKFNRRKDRLYLIL